jgi:hypothetical protein
VEEDDTKTLNMLSSSRALSQFRMRIAAALVLYRMATLSASRENMKHAIYIEMGGIACQQTARVSWLGSILLGLHC